MEMAIENLKIDDRDHEEYDGNSEGIDEESDKDVFILELVPPEAEVKKALPLPAKDEPKKNRKQPIITDFFRKKKFISSENTSKTACISKRYVYL